MVDNGLILLHGTGIYLLLNFGKSCLQRLSAYLPPLARKELNMEC